MWLFLNRTNTLSLGEMLSQPCFASNIGCLILDGCTFADLSACCTLTTHSLRFVETNLAEILVGNAPLRPATVARRFQASARLTRTCLPGLARIDAAVHADAMAEIEGMSETMMGLMEAAVLDEMDER